MRNRQSFLSFWEIFCPFPPLLIQKIKILKNWKKLLEILSFYTGVILSDGHMMYGSWNMERDRQFCHFGPYFSFYDPNNRKNQNFEKKRKKREKKRILHKCTKIIIICHTVPKIWRLTDVIFIFHFGLFFALLSLPPNSPKNKNEKALRDIILCICTKNYDHMICGSWDRVCDGRMDRQMDGRKKWHIDVSTPPNNMTVTKY